MAESDRELHEGFERIVAGGTALNLLTGGARISRDIDLFHDTNAALEAAWTDDRTLLAANGYDVRPLRERPAYVEAVVARDRRAAAGGRGRNLTMHLFFLTF